MSELDTRLAEIGRRLEEIQAGLAPDVDFEAARVEPRAAPAVAEAPAAEPADGPAEPEPRDSPRSGPLAALLARSRRRRSDSAPEDLAALVRMHNGLITALGELVRLLGQPGTAPRPAATVSAGPFRTPEEVEAFAARLSELAPVRAASIIGYEGADRALIEVQLADPSG